MIRVVVLTLLAAFLVVEPLPADWGPDQAEAHETCQMSASLYLHDGGTRLTFMSTIGCTLSHPGYHAVAADLSRRLPGGSWTIPPSGTYHISTTCGAGPACSTPTGFNDRNCRYDYRVIASVLDVDNHGDVSRNVKIKYASC